MMLNFAEQTGSGAVIMVWSFLPAAPHYAIYVCWYIYEQKFSSAFFPIFTHHLTNKTYSSLLLKQIHLCQTNNSSPFPYCQIPHCNSWSSIFSYNQGISFHFQIHTHSNQITPVCQKTTNLLLNLEMPFHFFFQTYSAPSQSFHQFPVMAKQTAQGFGNFSTL